MSTPNIISLNYYGACHFYISQFHNTVDFNKIAKNLNLELSFQPMGIEGPIFCRQKINYQPRLDITGFSAVGGRIFQIQNHRQLVELDQLQEQRTIDICRSGMVSAF